MANKCGKTERFYEPEITDEDRALRARLGLRFDLCIRGNPGAALGEYAAMRRRDEARERAQPTATPAQSPQT